MAPKECNFLEKEKIKSILDVLLSLALMVELSEFETDKSA